jgi:co-chaperonin GroES (HSP10)
MESSRINTTPIPADLLEELVLKASAGELRPLYDRVLIERVDTPERIGLIWVPEQAQKAMQVGRVVAVGAAGYDEDRHPAPPCCAVGDLVMYTGHWQGEDIAWGGKRLRLLEGYQVAAIIEDVDPSVSDIRVIHDIDAPVRR